MRDLLLLTVRRDIFSLVLDLVLLNDQIHDSFRDITLIFRGAFFFVLILVFELRVSLSVAVFVYV